MKICRENKVMYDMPRESMPGDVLATLAPEELEGFFNHHEYFGRLAAEANHPDIKRYLQRIAGQDIYWLMLYRSDEAPYTGLLPSHRSRSSGLLSNSSSKPRALPANLPKQLTRFIDRSVDCVGNMVDSSLLRKSEVLQTRTYGSPKRTLLIRRHVSFSTTSRW